MKKIRITETQLKYVLDNVNRVDEQTEQYPKEYKVTYKEKTTYPSGDSDPSGFVDSFVNNVIKEINKNPDTKRMFESGALGLKFAFIRGGASNVWKNPMKPEIDNNYRGGNYEDNPNFYTASEDEIKSNKDLAQKRAKDFWVSFSEKLKEKGITISPKLDLKVKSFIVDTGGKTDENKESKYKNPGQHIYVNLRFVATKTIKDKPFVPEPKDVLTGAYFCDGTNSKGQPRSVRHGCRKFRDKRMSAFEIKYKPNVLGNPNVIPVKRWLFHWSDEGKINKIVQVSYDETNKNTGYGNEVSRKNVPLDSNFMRLMMRGADVENPETRYEKNIKPYINNPFPTS